MGIIRGRTLCEKLLDNCRIHKSKFKKVILGQSNIYFDGPLLVFSTIKKFDTTVYGNDDNYIDTSVNLIVQKYKNILSQINGYCEHINKTIVVFDGKSPPMKEKTQSLRNTQKNMQLSPKMIENLYTKLQQKLISIGTTVNALDVGEAESVIYLKRDYNYSSILYTNDSDIFPIAYKHKPLMECDEVFCFMTTYKKKKYNSSMHRMKHFKCQLDHTPFRLLMVLAGTDFNEPIFTSSMTKAILEEAKKDNNNHIIDEINKNTNSIEFMIGKFMELIMSINFIGVSFPHNNSKCNSTYDDIIKKIEWVIGYFHHGNEYADYYNRELQNVTINKNIFLKTLVKKHFNLTRQMDPNERLLTILRDVHNSCYSNIYC